MINERASLQDPKDGPIIPASSALSKYKYRLLGTIYILATAGFFFRVSRQPYSQSMKWEQYESIFKATTLAATVASVAVSGGLNQRRSARDTGQEV